MGNVEHGWKTAGRCLENGCVHPAGQLAERLCQITTLVLWSKALERSSKGLLHADHAPTMRIRFVLGPAFQGAKDSRIGLGDF